MRQKDVKIGAVYETRCALDRPLHVRVDEFKGDRFHVVTVASPGNPSVSEGVWLTRTAFDLHPIKKEV
jgi:hypothetical protein